MTSHRLINEVGKPKELIASVSPEFDDMAEDIKEIMEKSKDPLFVGALMYKLVKEREKTNTILDELNEKYDKIMFEIKTTHMKKETAIEQANESTFQILPGTDQLILKYVEEKGRATAQEVQNIMNYKGLNAASQRLNKLFKEGYLKKVQSGKRVLYLVKN